MATYRPRLLPPGRVRVNAGIGVNAPPVCGRVVAHAEARQPSVSRADGVGIGHAHGHEPTSAVAWHARTVPLFFHRLAWLVSALRVGTCLYAPKLLLRLQISPENERTDHIPRQLSYLFFI
jgi:hypothetical protein